MSGYDSEALLAAIATELAGRDALERKRALRDLARVEQRLQRGDYRISAFGTNHFDIADRSAELINELEFMASIGRAWEGLIRESGLATADAVIEIGCGYTPKVQLGLLYAGFQGTLFALDRDPASLRDLERYLALFRPRYTLKPVAGSLYDAQLQPCRGVIANHLFDDLLLDAYSGKSGVPMRTIYGDESALRTAWEAIIADARAHTELAARIASSLARLAAPGGVVIVAQYQSYVERLLGLAGVRDTAVGLMDAVATGLGAMGFRARPDLVERALHGTKLVIAAGDCRALERTS